MPVVSSVQPDQGTTAGGTAVTIIGSGFLPSPVVRFGNTLATSVVRVSATLITCVTPANAEGVTNLRVTNTDTTYAVLQKAFNYITPTAPTVQLPVNYLPGVTVDPGFNPATLNGSPINAPVQIMEQGYYELKIAGLFPSVHPFCIVTPDELQVALLGIAWDGSDSERMSIIRAGLPEVYPRSKNVAPNYIDASIKAKVITDRAAVLEIRLIQGTTTVVLGKVVAKAGGVTLSSGFQLPKGNIKLKLALVLEAGDTLTVVGNQSIAAALTGTAAVSATATVV